MKKKITLTSLQIQDFGLFVLQYAHNNLNKSNVKKKKKMKICQIEAETRTRLQMCLHFYQKTTEIIIKR